MAKQNTSKMVATYTTDFGSTVNNLPVRWASDAPVPTGTPEFYANRTGICSASRIGFRPRYIQAVFPLGVHKYVLGDLSRINDFKTALIDAGAQCLDLIGESWGRLPPAVFDTTTPPVFKDTPYAAADITGAGDKQRGTFTYTSDILGSLKVGYSSELDPTALLTASKAGLVDAAIGTGVQNKNSLGLDPRHFTIHADVDDGTMVARRASASVIANLKTYINSIAPAAFYLTYQGESYKALHLL